MAPTQLHQSKPISIVSRPPSPSHLLKRNSFQADDDEDGDHKVETDIPGERLSASFNGLSFGDNFPMPESMRFSDSHFGDSFDDSFDSSYLPVSVSDHDSDDHRGRDSILLSSSSGKDSFSSPTEKNNRNDGATKMGHPRASETEYAFYLQQEFLRLQHTNMQGHQRDQYEQQEFLLMSSLKATSAPRNI